KADRDALAAENAAMREALDTIRIFSSDTLSGPSDSAPDMAAWLREGVEYLHHISNVETPATDAALAAIEARGVEKFAAWASEQESMARGAGDKKEARIYCQVEARAKHFAIKLREAK
ncbi:hypothetical protein BSQ97_25180, partial [Serratia proteamaculans]